MIVSVILLQQSFNTSACIMPLRYPWVIVVKLLLRKQKFFQHFPFYRPNSPMKWRTYIWNVELLMNKKCHLFIGGDIQGTDHQGGESLTAKLTCSFVFSCNDLSALVQYFCSLYFIFFYSTLHVSVVSTCCFITGWAPGR